MSNAITMQPKSMGEALAELNRLRDELAKAQASKATAGRISFKVSEAKGTLSVYGLGRFPVSLYASQWERLLAEKDAILAFIGANAATLTRKQ